VSSARKVSSVFLILTAQCNFRCSYCYQTAKKSLSMKWKTLRTAIDLAFDSTPAELKLLFIGGEPLLEWPKIRKAVEYAERNAPPGKHVGYTISTNGFLINDEVAAFLDEHKFELQLSFDGIAKAQDSRREGTFAALDRLLDMIHKRHPDLFHKMRINSTLIPATVPYLADSIRYLTKKGIRHIALSPCFTPSPGWTEKGIEDLEAQFTRIYDDSLRYFRRTGQIPFQLFRKGSARNSRPLGSHRMCSVMDGKILAVDVDGQVYGCVMFAESYQKFPSEFLRTRLAPLRMGNVQDPGFWKRYAAFLNVARSEEIFSQKERKYSACGKCGECRYLSLCSVCPVSIGYDPANVDPRRVPDFICSFNQMALKYRDRFPVMPDLITKIEALLMRPHAGKGRIGRQAQCITHQAVRR
jgi:sulfatase maturation enzyme AslB (radical SAM superfamily)